MTYGKSIKIFLIEGIAGGRWVCELSNWTGKAYKIPRTYVKASLDRPELAGAGIYFLFGKNDEDASDQVYIGEAENVLTRLNQHMSGKDFWTECVVFVSKDGNLNKAHIKYLENRFHAIASEAKRYEILNGNTPTKSTLSEADCAEMEEFIDNAVLLLSTLGHKVLEPAISTSDGTAGEDKDDYYYIQTGKGANAKGRLVADGFAVSKGSIIAKDTAPSMASSLLALRQRLLADGTIDANNIFTVDKVFTSPSLAAAVVLGRNANGLTEWRDADKVTLKAKEMAG